MRFQFDPNYEYQLDAITAVTGLFDGQVRIRPQMEFASSGDSTLSAFPNKLDLSHDDLLSNLRSVQQDDGISTDNHLEMIEGSVETIAGLQEVQFPNFSVEMETGTGKTYVYLRTILELSQRYGMRKFIIVVPSVAIREGVLKTLRITQEHFRRLYDNPNYCFYVYDSADLTQVRQFALSDAVEIMVMTIDSFNKAENVIRQRTDRLQGETPLHYIQAARPILVLDEPQNMESSKSIEALLTLNPLFALRYSATHRHPYNMVYRLLPAEAYQQGLVKKIEVASVVREHAVQQPYIQVQDVQSKKTRISAKLKVYQLTTQGTVKASTVSVQPGDSLGRKTRLPDYERFLVDEINPGGGYIRFSPANIELSIGEEIGADKDAVFQAQIESTIEEHFRKQSRLREYGIKVLSLFFIDRVDNYAPDDGIIRELFNEAFNRLKTSYPEWSDVDPEAVQGAYFARKRRKTGDIELLDSKTGESEDDREAYDLIMRDKESLLSFPSEDDSEEEQRKKQVCFIFSHSALREGWDNPNVFQICTLNQTVSPIRKRQEVGRGVRLAVDQSGNRIEDERVNILTIIANESYRDYVEQYQHEIASEYEDEISARYGKPVAELTEEERRRVEAEYGEGILPPPPREAGKGRAHLQKERALSPAFKELWERIKHKTRYSVEIDTQALIDETIPELEKLQISNPQLALTKAVVTVDDEGVFEAMQLSGTKTAVDLSGRYPLPNLVELMMNLLEHTSPPVRLTRRTLLELFKRVENRQQAIDNPQEWASEAVRILKEKLADHLVRGIKYEKINDHYQMQQILEEEEKELFSQHIVRLDPGESKTIYDAVPCDSEVEESFVRALEAREDVKLYLKLPSWFTVPTPVGEYQPDWAIVFEELDEIASPQIYFVAETKGSTSLDELRPREQRKILCGAAHFGSTQYQKQGALENVDFRVVTSGSELP